ncbi:TetR/AcrR family transcriptional regulator [Streptomyces sp. NPDC007916]|uniref:TetR/AcrR family transcriptional regulator n=1 Tax=Streptomyces sp. NPDC007916 TaxID=3364792 RepID=UPI000CC7BA8C
MRAFREQGLRERGKARRSEAVIRAAFELFAEQGYDATTVAEIAERAEVSPRTVAMYFRSKQDIAMSKFSEGADRLTEAMRNRSPDERAVDVLGRWLLAEYESGDDEMVELERRMFVANPELAALRTARMDAAIRESTRVVAEDLGVAPETVGPSSPSRTAAHHTARTPHQPRPAALQLTRATPTGRTTGRRQRTPPPAREPPPVTPGPQPCSRWSIPGPPDTPRTRPTPHPAFRLAFAIPAALALLPLVTARAFAHGVHHS